MPRNRTSSQTQWQCIRLSYCMQCWHTEQFLIQFSPFCTPFSGLNDTSTAIFEKSMKKRRKRGENKYSFDTTFYLFKVVTRLYHARPCYKYSFSMMPALGWLWKYQRNSISICNVRRNDSLYKVRIILIRHHGHSSIAYNYNGISRKYSTFFDTISLSLKTSFSKKGASHEYFWWQLLQISCN